MINLTNSTFITAVRIESEDREFNFLFVMQYLCNNFETTIIINEQDKKSKVAELLKQIDCKKTKIIHLFEESNDPVFYRTRLLNEALYMVRTDCVINYDCDVFMLPQAYKEAQDAILSGNSAVVYPYFRGESQIPIQPVDKALLNDNPDLPQMISNYVTGKKMWQSAFGHLQFFKTSVYREGGMEDENFISYGAEDTTRYHRFVKLGYNVQYLNNYIFHIEHSRGANSSASNPHYKANDDLYRDLMYMDAEQLREYYNNQEYLKKYKK